MRRALLITLIPLLLAGLACQAVYRVAELPQPTISPTLWVEIPTQTQSASPSATHPPFTATPTPYPTLQPTLTSTPSQTPTPTIQPTASAQQLRIFSELWEIVNTDYLYSDHNGLDWEAIYDEYFARISAGLCPDDFYMALDEMIFRLGDEHSIYLSPADASSEEQELAGENEYVGLGILTSTIPERERITIIAVFPGSPAEKAGLKAHDSILAINGHPILDETGWRRDLMHGIHGSVVELTVQTPGEDPRQVPVTRARVSGGIPVPYEVLSTTAGARIGYFLITTFADDTVPDQIRSGLEEMNAAAPLQGIILDNRQNGGGADTVAAQVLSYFTNGIVGYFTDRDGNRRTFRVLGSNIHGSAELPLVVLVGPDTVSFGEIFSGILQVEKRAYIIGGTTNGNIELLWGYDFEDGSRAWIAREAFRSAAEPKLDWELTGIVPDLQVSSDWDQYTLVDDPVVLAALKYLDQ